MKRSLWEPKRYGLREPLLIGGYAIVLGLPVSKRRKIQDSREHFRATGDSFANWTSIQEIRGKTVERLTQNVVGRGNNGPLGRAGTN